MVATRTGSAQSGSDPLGPVPVVPEPIAVDEPVSGTPSRGLPLSVGGSGPTVDLGVPGAGRLGHTWAQSDGQAPDGPFLRRSRLFRMPEERYRGPGQPLLQESWAYRPVSIGTVFGFVQGSTLIEDWIRANQGALGGFQLGWDVEQYWGLETRFAWAGVEVVDGGRAIAAQVAKDDAAGLDPDDPFRQRFNGRRNAEVFLWDAHVLYYPWGDSAWRPYLMLGMGATGVSFVDRTDVTYGETLFSFPFGLGVKYRVGDFLALRVECADYLAFGGGSSLEMLHHLTVIGGLEVRFGGPRRAYWPWNPGRHYW